MARRAKPPQRRQCATMQVHYRLLETTPGFRKAQNRLEHSTARTLMARSALARSGVIRIPVVVHVVWKRPAERIGIAQIRSQIKVLNRDFRARNADQSEVPAAWRGLVADAQLEFELATRDPGGKPTQGVIYTQTTRDSFGTGDTVKRASAGGADAWPAKRYLNFWVCNLADGLLGYAQFPGGPLRTDGVVILHTAFGTSGTAAAPFDGGRTAVHEVGHWLNLRHIWGDTEDCSGGDHVADTPNAELPNYGRPSFPKISCGNGPNGDMFMNYMDYVDDAGMFLFTTQQVARMRTCLDGPRSSIGTPAGAARRRRKR